MATDELRGLWVLRHGQSLGNVANDRARVAAVDRLDIAERDMDVPLSTLGERQAEAFGAWLGSVPPGEQPDVVVMSPYVRATQTAQLALRAAGLEVRTIRDERLREREFGVLDLLTRQGIVANHPTEAERRARLGKFYYRPPGGESWVDVALRLRSLRDSLVREHAGRRVMLVTHEVPIIILRYLIEDLEEADALALSASSRVANCSLTTYEPHPHGGLNLERDAWTAPLERRATPVTDEPDAAVAPR
jgi:broad specificity phosphatase PhoE